MQTIKPAMLKDMFIGGADNLINNKEYVDRLNVFPVPDGDTGTNMSLTLKSAIEELKNINDADMTKIGEAVKKGSLMGARGNSGVILSQILRGFARYIDDKQELGIKDFAYALDSSTKVAYKAVIKPVEGTILTVIRETAEFATGSYNNYDDFNIFFDDIIVAANTSLKNTPNLLKELKQANVVDSGGQGFVFFLEGMIKTFKGEKLIIHADKTLTNEHSAINQQDRLFEEDIHIFDEMPEFGYCTEFMLKSDKITPQGLQEKIQDLGNSLIVVGADDIIKIHIHSNNPGHVLEIAGSYGELDRLKIENMRLEFTDRLAQNKQAQGKTDEVQTKKEKENQKSFAIISVATGDGITKIMEESGVDYVIEGGQTMNPSTQDFLNAINALKETDIIIMPNNSNIIMAAEQAQEMSEKNVKVLRTKEIPQAIEALISMDFFGSFDENVQKMSNALDNVKSGQVTFAVRDTEQDGLTIKKDDIIGLSGKKILASEKTINAAVKKLLDKMVDEDSELVTVYYGKDVNGADSKALNDELAKLYPDLEIDFFYGGQPVYYYIISVE